MEWVILYYIVCIKQYISWVICPFWQNSRHKKTRWTTAFADIQNKPSHNATEAVKVKMLPQ